MVRRRSRQALAQLLGALEVHALDASLDDALDDHPEAVERERLPGLRHATEELVHESADGRDALAVKVVEQREYVLEQ